MDCLSYPLLHDRLSSSLLSYSRAGRFGTKGLAITFVSSETDQTVMNQIQARFEVAVPELPDKIDKASYSMCDVILVVVPLLKYFL